MNWGSAIAGAVGAVANVGVQDIDRQQRLQDQADAEQRAADVRLNMQERLMAIEEAQKNRAAERFASVTKDKMGEDVPVAAPTVQQTGLTDASAGQLITGADGAPVNVAFHGDQAANLKAMQAIIDNPRATAEQRQDAKQAIDAITAQTAKQGEVNAKGVEGQTRKRTISEARDAALADTATSDAPAFMAGTSMWKSAMDNERKDREDALHSKDRALDRESDEKRTGMQTDQRAASTAAETARKAAADAARDATNQKRIEALAGGKGGKATALMQNVKMLEDRGYSKDEVDRFIFQTKDSSEAEKVFKMLTGNNNKYGELSLDDAVKQVRSIGQATGKSSPGGASAPAAAGRTRKWDPATGTFK